MKLLLAMCVASAVALGAAPGQAPAQGQGAGRGIQPQEHPVLPTGAPLPEFALPGVDEELAQIKARPVTVDMVDADGVKALRANVGTGKTMLVSFWSTACALCAAQFLDLENSYRMYRLRQFDFTTVSTDPPSKNADVVTFLKSQYAGGPNKQFASADTGAVQAAWGARWNPSAPFTAVIAPDGKVLYQKEGKIDILELRRVILSSIPDSQGYPGNQAYFQDAVAKMNKKKK